MTERRPPYHVAIDPDVLRSLVEAGRSDRDIAKLYGVATTTITRKRTRAGIYHAHPPTPQPQRVTRAEFNHLVARLYIRIRNECWPLCPRREDCDDLPTCPYAEEERTC